MSRQTHAEYAVQSSMVGVEGYPQWWIATEWRRSPEDAVADYNRFLLRNRNAGVNEILGMRMIRRMVEDYEVLSTAEKERLLAECERKRAEESEGGEA